MYRLLVMATVLLLGGFASSSGDDASTTPSPTTTAQTAAAPAVVEPPGDYEVWATDQANSLVYIISSGLEVVDTIDFGALGMVKPHWIEFTSDYRYAFITNAKSGDMAVVRASDRQVVKVLKTGPTTHAANVYPDDSGALVSVIGDGALVEIVADLERESFTIGRRLVLNQDPVILGRAAEFGATSPSEPPKAVPVTATFTRDGAYAYVPIGPSLANGGLAIMNMNAFQVEKVFPLSEVATNLMGRLSPDGTRMYVNGGSPEATNLVYVFDTASHEPLGSESTQGGDAHGMDFTPDGRELWVVNRKSSTIAIIDTETDTVKEKVSFFGTAPDLLAISPDGRYAFVTLSGSKPADTGAMSDQGDVPGVSVIDVKGREPVKLLLQPEAGNPDDRDFHGLAIRLLK